MMNQEQLEARRNEIVQALEKSAANHNSLAGRLGEVDHMLKLLQEAAVFVEKAAPEVMNLVEVLETVV